ncbi:hypothetical protein AKJ28_15505 [Corynebacterium glutamicum]|nr:hypothetical protein AKJ28_15505 [Corynebacterium glutamicum]
MVAVLNAWYTAKTPAAYDQNVAVRVRAIQKATKSNTHDAHNTESVGSESVVAIHIYKKACNNRSPSTINAQATIVCR